MGSPPTNAGCDGVNTPCTYNLIGEVNTNLTGLLATLPTAITTSFTVHADMAPTIQLAGNPPRTSATARAFGRAVANLTGLDPYKRNANTAMTAAIVDPVGMGMLHMVTADPLRTPTLRRGSRSAEEWQSAQWRP